MLENANASGDSLEKMACLKASERRVMVSEVSLKKSPFRSA